MRLRQKHCKLEASLAYITSLKTKQNKTKPPRNLAASPLLDRHIGNTDVCSGHKATLQKLSGKAG
jgi:hypothetical protein